MGTVIGWWECMDRTREEGNGMAVRINRLAGCGQKQRRQVTFLIGIRLPVWWSYLRC